ncbi:MAG: C39 family peptidase [bacterium]
MKKLPVILLLLLISASALIVVLFLTGVFAEPALVPIKIDTTPNQSTSSDNGNIISTKISSTTEIITKQATTTFMIPAQLDLGVPFVSQAPLRDWAMPYQEACEEASMIAVSKYYTKGALDSQTINRELLALMTWEGKQGYPNDLTAQQTSDILLKYFNLSSHLDSNVTVDKIKYELSKGHPIIVPAAGRLLGNPYFHQPGPIFHMLVIRGYDSSNFITDDVGTNTKGERFKYKYQKLINAIHDWSPDLAQGGMTDAEMAQGRKVMIVIDNL